MLVTVLWSLTKDWNVLTLPLPEWSWLVLIWAVWIDHDVVMSRCAWEPGCGNCVFVFTWGKYFAIMSRTACEPGSFICDIVLSWNVFYRNCCPLKVSIMSSEWASVVLWLGCFEPLCWFGPKTKPCQHIPTAGWHSSHHSRCTNSCATPIAALATVAAHRW